MSEKVRVAAKKPEAKRENKVSQTQKIGHSQSIRSPVEQILFLQRTIGNQAVRKLIKSGALQAKLRIGQPGDIYEKEADRVAEQVMRIPESQVAIETKVSNPARSNYIQRKCPGCNKGTKIEKEEEGEKLQKKEASGSAHGVTPGVEDSISAVHGGGQPLPGSVRAFYEPRFGHDFSHVRVHTDAKAAESARAVNATAYTMGQDIVFGAGRFEPGTHEGRQLIAHELAHTVQQGTSVLPSVQRKCHADNLGAPNPDCKPSQQGVAGWQFLFKVGCDDLLPGEESKIDKLKTGSQLKIHGFASREGDKSFNEDLSCHRANRILDLVCSQRADCPVIGTFKHGASPVSAPGVAPDINPPDFWRSVIIEEIKSTLESGEQWLDPGSKINQGWVLLNRAQVNPTQTNLDVVAARRSELKTWLEGIGKSLAPPGAKLTRTNLDDYRRFYQSAENLWAKIDQLLALQKHADAAKDTYDRWAKGTGKDQGDRFHAKNVPTGVKYHVDIFGEGYFKGAINIGMAERTSTTGVFNTRVPNLIYRRFSYKDANKLPIADHVADLVTSENGPIGFPGLAEEIARIIAPGGTIVLYNPESEEAAHDKVAKATGGTVKKVRSDQIIQTTIIVPGP